MLWPSGLEKEGEMPTWSSSTTFEDDPRRVMDVLTQVESIERWSPVPFRLVDQRIRQLATGDHLTVEGRLIGRGLRFSVEVAEVTATRLRLRASGPFEIDVAYELDTATHRIIAEVETNGSGLLVRIFISATNALLAAGALDHALARILREAGSLRPLRPVPELVPCV
jgi:hypothetical protein